jgi:acetyltransferase-like isoleucine patch superfamily enzyme
MHDSSKPSTSNTTLRKHFQKIISPSVEFVLLSVNITKADCCHILEGSDHYIIEGSVIRYVTRQVVVSERVIVSSNVVVRKNMQLKKSHIKQRFSISPPQTRISAPFCILHLCKSK